MFADDINDFPPEHGMEFSINLVPSTGPVSMTPYWMSASELSELKNYMEYLLEKKFFLPSISSWGRWCC